MNHDHSKPTNESSGQFRKSKMCSFGLRVARLLLTTARELDETILGLLGESPEKTKRSVFHDFFKHYFWDVFGPFLQPANRC